MKIKAIKAFEILDSRGTPTIAALIETDDGFKEVLSKIGENHKGSHLHKASGKDIKTREIVKKHAKIQARKKK